LNLPLLETTIATLLKTYEGGQKYFSILDLSVQHKQITDKLFSLTPQNNIIIASGKFGQFVNNIYPEKNLFIVEGGIRHSNYFSLENKAEQIKHKDFIFIDDSYYSGKTRNAIRAEIERLGGNFKHTYVVYDGSKWKNKNLTSLYRYHERY